MKFRDMLLVSKVEELDNIELNRWRKRNEREPLRLLLFDFCFVTQENAGAVFGENVTQSC